MNQVFQCCQQIQENRVAQNCRQVPSVQCFQESQLGLVLRYFRLDLEHPLLQRHPDLLLYLQDQQLQWHPEVLVIRRSLQCQ